MYVHGFYMYVYTCIIVKAMYMYKTGIQTPEGKARGMSVSIQHTKPIVSMDTVYKHVFSAQELYECLPWPSETILINTWT
jgi:hypothetical protein